MPTIKRTLKVRQQKTNFGIVQSWYKSDITKNNLFVLFLLRYFSLNRIPITKHNFVNHIKDNTSTNNSSINKLWLFAATNLNQVNNSRPYLYQLKHSTKLILDKLEC